MGERKNGKGGEGEEVDGTCLGETIRERKGTGESADGEEGRVEGKGGRVCLSGEREREGRREARRIRMKEMGEKEEGRDGGRDMNGGREDGRKINGREKEGK